ncbi:Endonuclease/exonuclease/phosphatase [Dipodascopsis tothii]|uniref:Endonuclease/exonuclease/phosphatase n=1 Tax=Dipodascopsis tothii TaxID=44089 RepID=UPI0034CFF013
MASTVTIALFTYNCGKVLHPVESLRRPLDRAIGPAAAVAGADGRAGAVGPAPDVVVLSLQEIAPVQTCFFGSVGPFIEPFVQALDALGYVAAGREVLGSTACVVFLAARARYVATDVRRSSFAFGPMATSLKGAAGVRLTLTPVGATDGAAGADFTFVAAHFAANEGMRGARDLNFSDMAANLFAEPGHGAAGLYAAHTHLFVLGDLNYRVDFAEKRALAWSADAHKDFFACDELTDSLASEKAFYGLAEPPVLFPPTYKFSEHAPAAAPAPGLAPTRPYSSKRTPSWCDRILHLRYGPGTGVRVHAYTSVPELTESDHIPVVQSVTVPLKAPQDVVHDAVAALRAHPGYGGRRWRAGHFEHALGYALYLGDPAVMAVFVVLLAATVYALLRTAPASAPALVPGAPAVRVV